MGWLKDLASDYWQNDSVERLDAKIASVQADELSAEGDEGVLLATQEDAQVEELRMQVARLTLLLQGLAETCARKGVLTRDEIMALAENSDLPDSFARWTPPARTAAADDGDLGTTIELEEVADDESPTDVGLGGIKKDDGGFDFGSADTSDADDSFGFGDTSESGAGTAPSMTATAARPQRKKSSPLRPIIGVAGGGVLGLSLGYFILLWIGGPQKDFLKLGEKLPPFLVPAAFHASDASGGVASEQRTTAPSDSVTPPDNGRDFSELENKFAGVNGNQDQAGGANLPRKKKQPADLEDPLGGEPGIESPFEDPLAAPEDPLASTLPEEPATKMKEFGVRGAEAVSADALGAALKAANDQKDALLTDSAQPVESPTKEKGLAYAQVAALARAYTYATGDPAENQLGERKKAVETLVRSIAESEQSLLDIGYITQRWIDAGRGDGVALIGHVRELEPQGDLFICRVVPYGQSGEALTVVTAGQPPFIDGEDAVFIGAVVQDPAGNLIGYEGEEEQVIWAPYAERLDE